MTCCFSVVQDAPYLLEECAQGFANEEDEVQLALLSAAMKLFFKRPPECQHLLGAALAAASAETSQDVHDRALLYYRCGVVLALSFCKLNITGSAAVQLRVWQLSRNHTCTATRIVTACRSP